MKKDDCVFCKIVNGEIPSATIYENSDFKIILDVAPVSKGHALIIPREHYDNIYEMDADTAGKLFALGTALARGLRDELKCDGLNVVQNNGEVAGQSVNHFHMHFVPRYKGDGVSIGTWSPKESDSKELQDLAKNLHKRI